MSSSFTVNQLGYLFSKKVSNVAQYINSVQGVNDAIYKMLLQLLVTFKMFEH